jgi:uncharacterized protein (DUF1501 family)
MDRREFLRIAALAGLAVAAPVGRKRARAQSAPYDGPYWVMVNAGGGWDPIYLCDPKLDPSFNRLYTQVKTAGPISFAPLAADLSNYNDAEKAYISTVLLSHEAFFTKYAGQLTIINGIDTATNNHDSGSRTTWSGQLSEGYPALAAIIAAAKAPDRPMAFLSSGGYDITSNVIPLTRINDLGSLRRIAYPNRMNADDPSSQTYHMPSTVDRIRSLQLARLQRQLAFQQAPRLKRSVSALYFARQTDLGLDRLDVPMPAQLDSGALGDLQQLMQQAQISIAAFKSGLAVSANLDIGGFDTHSDHDRSQVWQLAQLLTGIDFIMQEAARQGLADKVVVVVGSDFGRGPGFNGMGGGAGKDHWSVTSMMMLGARIPGGRVIGGTDAEQKASPVDPTTLQPAAGARKVIGTPDVHRALRRLAGVDGTPTAAKYPLQGADLPIFG